MRLGLHLGMGCFGGSVLDPNTLGLTEWWRGSFSASPWVGQISSGNLSEATNPPAAGTAVNGFTPADFDGTNDKLTGDTSTFFSGATGFAAVLFKADTAMATGLNAINNPGLVSDAGGPRAHLGFADNGLWASVYNGAAWVQGTAVAAATGTWTWGFMWWAGGTLYCQKNNGTPQTVAVGNGGNVSLASNALLIGETPVGSKFFDGKILEIMLGNTDLSARIAEIVGYGNSRYGLSL